MMNVKVMYQMWFTHAGSIISNGELIIPYGLSDYSSSFATVNLEMLLKKLVGRKASVLSNKIFNKVSHGRSKQSEK